jgi:hypothetical protein
MPVGSSMPTYVTWHLCNLPLVSYNVQNVNFQLQFKTCDVSLCTILVTIMDNAFKDTVNLLIRTFKSKSLQVAPNMLKQDFDF